MAMKMDGEKIFCDCILCDVPFQRGPHVYNGRHIGAWDVEICDLCVSRNRDGIMPDRHPRLIAHLRTKGVPIKLNPKGWLNIPGV
jgi:hypothetical protein